MKGLSVDKNSTGLLHGFARPGSYEQADHLEAGLEIVRKVQRPRALPDLQRMSVAYVPALSSGSGASRFQISQTIFQVPSLSRL